MLGAALALEVTGHVLDAHGGIARAREALESGAARALLTRVVAFGKEHSK